MCFGRQFASWMHEQLLKEGLTVLEVVPEDWGWCVVVQRKPFLLWISCVNVHDYFNSSENNPLPIGNEVVWTSTIVAEQSLISKLFYKQDTESTIKKLFNQVHKIIQSDSANTIITEPRQ